MGGVTSASWDDLWCWVEADGRITAPRTGRRWQGDGERFTSYNVGTWAPLRAARTSAWTAGDERLLFPLSTRTISRARLADARSFDCGDGISARSFPCHCGRRPNRQRPWGPAPMQCFPQITIGRLTGSAEPPDGSDGQQVADTAAARIDSSAAWATTVTVSALWDMDQIAARAATAWRRSADWTRCAACARRLRSDAVHDPVARRHPPPCGRSRDR